VVRAAIAAALLVSALLALWALSTLSACGGTDATRRSSSRTGGAGPTSVHSTRVEVDRIGRLPAPVQLPAAASGSAGQVLALGGLSSADVSTDDVVVIDRSGRARAVGRLPSPVHDAAAAAIAGRVYLMGGGDLASSATILRVRSDGQSTSVGRLPTVASDLSAATIGSSAYVVGGYTGSIPLRSIIAFTPGRPARVVASLDRPLRYAAVAAVGNAVMIAGGTSGVTAQRTVFRFDPSTNRVAKVGRLPHPVTHAAGASLGGRLYVIGGRGSAVDSATSAIWSVDPASGEARAAGRLPVALSDIGAATVAGGAVLIGGRDRGGQAQDEILRAKVRR
jgi:hypothetical protein